MPNAAPTSQEEHQEPETKPETVSTGVLRITVPNGLRTLTVAKVLTLDLKPSTRNALQGCEGIQESIMRYRHPKRTVVRGRSSNVRRFQGYRSGSKPTSVEAAAMRNERKANRENTSR
jgi:hypothetical protein